MSRLPLLRVAAAGLLAVSGAAFAVGSGIERASHHETAAQHAQESAVAPQTTAAATAAPTAARSTPPAAPEVARAPAVVTKDPRLQAPEGSKEREAGEHAARQAKATPRPTPTGTTTPTGTVTPAAPTPAAVAAGSPTQAPEGSAAREAAERAGDDAGPQTAPGEASERLFGVNPESTGLVAATVAVTALLALLVLLVPARRGLRWAAAAAVLFCAGAVALDVREVAHQHAVGTNSVLIAAVVVAVLHALAGVAAAALPLAAPRAPRAVSIGGLTRRNSGQWTLPNVANMIHSGAGRSRPGRLWPNSWTTTDAWQRAS